MQKLFKRIPFPAKLMLISIIPLALVIYLAFQLQSERNERIRVLDNYLLQIKESAEFTKVINEMQAERRYSFGYFFKDQWQNQMLAQRSVTDIAIRSLEASQVEEFLNFGSYTLLDSLSSIRSRIDNKNIQANEIFNYYTNSINRLNALINIPPTEISYLKPLNNELIGSKLIAEMITNLGILRANIFFQINSDIITSKTAEEFRNNYELYNSLSAEFIMKAPPAAISKFKEITSGADYKRSFDFLHSVFAENDFSNGMTADEWWNISARSVDELKALQQSLIDNLLVSIDELSKSEVASRDRYLVFLVMFIALVLVIVLYTINSISKSLSELRAAANKLSKGETGIEIDQYGKDVIGHLAASISKIENTSTQLSIAAAEIGKGNFSVSVQPRSDGDEMGNAIVKMKDDLQKLSNENSEKIWIQSGITYVNRATRGEKSMQDLAADTLQALVGYLGVERGMFYIKSDAQILEYKAGYAVEHVAGIQKSILPGERLIGQAAISKEMIHLQKAPDDYIKISSAMGAASPGSIIIFPVLHNNQVEGVMELATLSSFSNAAIQLLEQLSNSIAIAIHSCKSRMRLQELLEMTQSQAEELQAQHAELENMNAELEVQAEKLQASEEELRVQQEELIQANQELEERTSLLEEKNFLIIERNREIQTKAEELAQSTRYKSEFLANMSHELRTPLNSILLLSRLLSENHEKNLSEEQVEFAKVIQNSGNGLLNLIDEILDLSKIESGKMELDYQVVSIENVVYELRSIFAPIAKEKNVELHIEQDENLPATIETDKLRLEQILKNLLSNALKFTAKGSVKVSITKPAANGHILFKVKDTGIGIPEDKLTQIFEAFQQADGSTQRKYGGTGLGLSISRELTRLLGGSISLTSKLGEGSEFILSIPISKELAKPAAPAVAEQVLSPEPTLTEKSIEEVNHKLEEQFIADNIPPAIPDDRHTIKPGDKVILIVEDDTGFAKSLMAFSRQKGYKVIASVRGDEGIEMAQKYKPAGILLDIQLPVKDGWQVMEELKGNKETRHIPVHIMSSMGVKNKSLSSGAVDFINKPFAFEQMEGVFQKLEYVLKGKLNKVLIVEENPHHAKALAYYLETFNLNTVIRNEVKDGVSALVNNEIDCVILDMGIPDENAYQTLEEVKQNPGLENLPIIIFTGKSLSRKEELRIKRYADSIVIKTAHSYQRILDEVSLFLHVVEENKESENKVTVQKKLGVLGEVLKGKKVLVADDDVRNIFSLTKALEQYNMEVVSAVDGKDALRQLDENKGVDIILMDMMMPEMDGYESIRQIRSLPKYKNLPIIAVTAKAMMGDREKCINAGASDYITKPVDTDQLISLLRVWLYDAR